MMRWFNLSILIVLLISGVPSTSSGQSTEDNEPSGQSGESGVDMSDVTPGFAMDKLVTELSARIGQQVTFRFELKSLGGTKQIRVRPVRLVQSRDGSIGIGPEEANPDSISLDGPSEIELSEEEPAILQGTIDVTQEGGDQRYYGVLVRDMGRNVDVAAEREQQEDDEQRIQINYVTRYLLRVELDVTGAPPPNYDNVTLTDAGISSRDGRAYVEAVLQNDTNTVLDVRVRARLREQEGRLLGPPFFLSPPAHESLAPPERFEVDVLPGEEVELSRQVPEPVYQGNYTLVLEIRKRARTVGQIQQTVTVKKGQFPAQDQVTARIVSNIRVQPSSVKFSRRPKGNRVQSLTLKNQSDQNVRTSVEAHPRGEPGKRLPWLTMRPDTFELREGGRQDLFLSVSTQDVSSRHLYGFLVVSVEPTETSAGGSLKIPVSFLGQGEIDLEFEIGKLQPESHNNQPVLALPVTNKSNVHFEVRAEAEIQNPFGGTTSLKGGFGRWILPGETERVRFQLDKIPPSGEYPVNISLRLGHGKDPIEVERSFQIP